jgi:hypothetical protein
MARFAPGHCPPSAVRGSWSRGDEKNGRVRGVWLRASRLDEWRDWVGMSVFVGVSWVVVAVWFMGLRLSFGKLKRGMGAVF